MGHKLIWLSTLLFLIGSLQICFSQQNKIDSLRAELKQNTDKNQKAHLNLKLYFELHKKVKDSALLHLNKVKKNYENLNDSIIGHFHIAKMIALLDNNKYDSVSYNFNEAIKQKKHLNPNLLSSAYMHNGLAFYFKGDYTNAIKSYKDAEQIIDTNEKLKKLKPRILNNIGIVYIQMENWEMAQKYMERSLFLCKEANIKMGISYTLGNLGIIYKNLKDINKAINAYEEAGEIFKELKNTNALARNHQNIASLLEEQGNLNTAMKENQKSLALATSVDNEQIMATALHNIGNIYSKQDNYVYSAKSLEKALKISQKLSNKKTVSDIFMALSKVNERIGSHKNALAYYHKYHNLNDSLVGEKNLNAISELEIKYETEKKENEILTLSEAQLKSDKTIAAQDRKLKQMTLGLAALSIIALLTFFLYKQRLQNKKQNELLLAISETQTAERKRISQDLHDSIGGSLALTKSKLQNGLSKFKEVPSEMKEAILALNKTSDQVRQISHNLMPGELVRFGLVPAINTLLEQLNKEELNAQLYTTQMENRIEPIKEIQLYRIVQEAIQNVLKHAKAKNLYIHLNKHKQHISVLIEDDGIGFLPNIKEGLGLKNIEQRIKLLNGSFTLDSAENKGTTLNIQIPV